MVRRCPAQKWAAINTDVTFCFSRGMTMAQIEKVNPRQGDV